MTMKNDFKFVHENKRKEGDIGRRQEGKRKEEKGRKKENERGRERGREEGSRREEKKKIKKIEILLGMREKNVSWALYLILYTGHIGWPDHVRNMFS